MISVILYGRNDSHGYNMHKRFAISLNCLAEVLTHPSDEIIFVDCNTPDGMPTFPEAIQDILTTRAKQLLRILRIRPDLYEKHKRGSHLKVLESLSRNAAIRRSNPANRWILSTNPDMVFVSRKPGQSLSDVASQLPDGFYELPRFEVPAALWETVNRMDPKSIIAAFERWGRTLHLNEVIYGQPYNIFDGPGDFQLVLREQMFTIQGFDEKMVKGWHVDSNLCKRLNLLNGKTGSLLDYFFGYHCDHTRQPTMAHGFNRKEGNDWFRFVENLTSPYLPAQADTWGIPDEPIEEIRLTNGNFVRVLESLLPGVSVPYTEDMCLPKSYNHSLLYDNLHALPFVVDHLITLPPTADIGYLGGNAELLRLMVKFRKDYGHTGRILFDPALLKLANQNRTSPLPSQCMPVEGKLLFEKSFVFFFDTSMTSFSQSVNTDGVPIPEPSAEVLHYAWQLYATFLHFAKGENHRMRDGKELQRKFLVIGSQHTCFESAITEVMGFVLSAFSSRIRQGYIHKNAFMRPLNMPPFHTLMVDTTPQALSKRFEHELGRPVSEKECQAAACRTGDFISTILTASVDNPDTFIQTVIQTVLDIGLADIDLAHLRLQLLIENINCRKWETKLLRNLLDLLEGIYGQNIAKVAQPDIIRTLKEYKERLNLNHLKSEISQQISDSGPHSLSVLTQGSSLSVRWISSLLDVSEYARHAREALWSLSRGGVRVQAVPLYVDRNFIALLSPKRRQHLETCIANQVQEGALIFFHHPSLLDGSRMVDFYSLIRSRHPGFTAYVGATSFECASIPDSWVDACNGMDEIWVPSHFNVETFSKAGVNPDRLYAFSFGLDTKAYDPQRVKPFPIRDRRGFTFLSTFEWSPCKGWDILLRAYIEAFSIHDDVCLVLKIWAPDGNVRKKIIRFIGQLGRRLSEVPPIIILRQKLSEREMPSLYATADAFVLPSRGEGWGIPYLEAMAMGLPTIGTRWSGNLDFMNDANSLLIDINGLVPVDLEMVRQHPQFEGQHWAQPSVQHLTELMRWVYEHRQEARQRGQQARADFLAHWTLDHMAERILTRLRALTKRSPPHLKSTVHPVANSRTPTSPQDEKGQTLHAAKETSARPEKPIDSVKLRLPTILWHAPLFDLSEYADEARQFILGLDSTGMRVRAVPLPWNKERAVLPPEDFFTLQCLITTQVKHLDKHLISIFHAFPPRFRRILSANYHIGRIMFETDRIPDDWVPACNQMDEIWVPSDFNIDSFVRSGVLADKLVKIPEGIGVERYQLDTPPVPIDSKRGFNFLSVFDWTWREGWDVLLRAFIEEFRPEEDVALILKVRSTLGRTVKQLQMETLSFLRQVGLANELPPNVVFYQAKLPIERLPGLYRAADAFVLPTRGEGWGRPFMKAMLMELPVIGTRWSGHLEFMNDDNAYLIDFKVVDIPQRAWREAPTLRGHHWAEPSPSHLRQLMRQVFEDHQGAHQKGQAARQHIIANFSRERVVQKVKDRLEVIAESLEARNEGQKARGTGRVQVAFRPAPLALVWEGSQFVHHSLALVNRELCLRLLEQDGVELSIIPYEPDQFGPEVDPRFRKLAARVQAPLSRSADVHIRHRWPPNFNPPPEGHWVMMQPWEYGAIPVEWVKPINTMVDELWVPSRFVKDCYIQSGINPERTFVIPNGVNFDLFNPQATPLKLKTEKGFKFLFVGGTIWRKGIDILLQAYRQNFTAKDDVCLVIKDMGQDSFYRGQGAGKIIKEMQKDKDAPEILYLKAIISEDKMAGLYTACDCLVHPYRGEGFGLPVAEALSCGLPAILTKGGACDEFCPSDDIYWVPFQRREIKIKLKTAGEPWVLEPSPEVLGQRLKEVYAHREAAKKKGLRLAQKIRKTLSWEKSADLILSRITSLRDKPILRKEGRQKMSAIKGRRAVEYMKMGNQHREDEENKLAERFYQKSLENDPNNQEALQRLGTLLYEEGRFEEAIPLYQKLTKIEPWSAEYFQTLGECFFKSEKITEAKSVLQKGLDLDPTNAQIQSDLGVIFWQEGNLEEALNHLQEALKIAPENPETILNLALICYQVGLYEEAAGLLEKYAHLEAPGADVHLCLGDCYFNLEKKDLAKREFELALSLDPDMEEAQKRLKELQV